MLAPPVELEVAAVVVLVEERLLELVLEVVVALAEGVAVAMRRWEF